MKTLAEIKLMILSSQDVIAANNIIDENYDFVTFGEKIAFLKGMFGAELFGKLTPASEQITYFAMLSKLLSLNLLASHSVRKTLTIPAWLNNIAEEMDINFSQTLQEALKEKIGLK